MNSPTPGDSPSVLFAVTEDWYFWSHRQPLAAYLQRKGCKISLATRFNKHERDCTQMGIAAFAISFERSLRHPFRDLAALIGLYRAIRSVRPDIVHLVSHKPILLSALSLFACSQTKFIAAFTGMGYLFTSSDNKARWFQRLVVFALRIILRRPNVTILVQNDEDRRLLTDERIGRAERTVIISGVGVDTDVFDYSEIDFSSNQIVVLPARLIRDKGIEEFIAAAREVRRLGMDCRFVLVGAEDPDNPAAIAAAQIDSWVREGVVEWWGHRDNMPEVYRAAHIVCLPSYREGLPKVLLEAAACGRPIIASDISGCREICHHGINGTLIKVRNSKSLAAAVVELLHQPDRQKQFGMAGRKLVKKNFSVEKIGAETLQLYRSVLD